MKKISCFLMILLTSLISLACQSLSERYERVNTVFPEVDYGYISYNDSHLMNDFNHLDLKESAAKILKKNIDKLSYPYSIEVTDNFIYYLIEYGNKKSGFLNNNPEINQHKFDIALFRVDIYLLETELIYRFEAVYPTYLYQYTQANTYYSVVDDQILLFRYNGKIELFDLDKKEIVFQKELHDKEAYTNSVNYPYRTNQYGDVYAIIEGTLYYYQFATNTYLSYEFPAGDSFYTDRYDDYLILSYFTQQTVYEYAYSLENQEAVDLATAIRYKEEMTDNDSEALPYDFLFKDTPYNYTLLNGVLTFKKLDSEEEVILDHETMMTSNEAYQSICQLWNIHDTISLEPVFLTIVDNRLLIVFMNTEWGGYKPAFIFEYDIESRMSNYVGYHYNHIPAKIILADL